MKSKAPPAPLKLVFVFSFLIPPRGAAPIHFLEPLQTFSPIFRSYRREIIFGVRLLAQTSQGKTSRIFGDRNRDIIQSSSTYRTDASATAFLKTCLSKPRSRCITKGVTDAVVLFVTQPVFLMLKDDLSVLQTSATLELLNSRTTHQYMVWRC